MAVISEVERVDFAKHILNYQEGLPERERSPSHLDLGSLNVNCRTDRGSALISAIQSSQLNLVRHLVEHCGADPCLADLVGIEPIYVATFKGQVETVAYLLERGARVNGRGPSNSTLLHICAERNFHQIAKVILEKCEEKQKDLIF
mmetsp:Transcript_17709/g.29953  ORF Transcript_17709/g.29953 Transcript_17709/m.29953 type:complete len:146 (+) Transcript_17709:378-815(+)